MSRATSTGKRPGAQAGFTLIEVLIATVLMGVILVSLATVTAQWLPNWNRGMMRVQTAERLAFAVNRILEDLAVAEIVTPNNTAKLPIFDGSELALTFVRTAIGPNSRPGLEVVRYIERGDKDGPALVRERVPFIPMETGAPLRLGDPVVLIRAPFRVTFSYSGAGQSWQPTWQGAAQLPRRVRVTIRDGRTQEVTALSTATVLRVDTPSVCVAAKSVAQCVASPQQPAGDADQPAARTNNL